MSPATVPTSPGVRPLSVGATVLPFQRVMPLPASGGSRAIRTAESAAGTGRPGLAERSGGAAGTTFTAGPVREASPTGATTATGSTVPDEVRVAAVAAVTTGPTDGRGGERRIVAAGATVATPATAAVEQPAVTAITAATTGRTGATGIGAVTAGATEPAVPTVTDQRHATGAASPGATLAADDGRAAKPTIAAVAAAGAVADQPPDGAAVAPVTAGTGRRAFPAAAAVTTAATGSTVTEQPGGAAAPPVATVTGRAEGLTKAASAALPAVSTVAE